MSKSRVLIVSEDRLTQKSLYELICQHGYEAGITHSIKDVMAYLDEKICHVILADIACADDIAMLKLIKEKGYPSQIITMASHGNTEENPSGVAVDCLIRPVEDKNIISSIERALSKVSGAESRSSFLKKLLHKEDTFYDLVGQSPSFKEIYSLIERISSSRATILLRGESGTGKRMIARAIHKSDKKRRDKPFMEISCGALPREIIESELFGHTKGSFTGAINERKGRFELAHGGTVLLDDIDSFSLDLQVKLLRVLQHKEFERVGDHKTIKVDVRFIVSTNQDLEKAIADKKFREDLYYRLNVISITVPPLRNRKDDLPLLVNHFMNLYSKENHKKIKCVLDDTISTMMNYDWPGNIRELENIIERAVILDTDGVIGSDDLPELLVGNALLPFDTKINGNVISAVSLKDALKEPERVYILQVMEEMGWNKKRAAKRLGVNRTTLYNKLKKYNLLAEAK
ncbi:MAG: sigma-54 dependent transcriptional regulator [Candidatus Omnitrophota bacterium]|nr:sigma-54 dependent transcriptional regulator [Candidatus Omnitrophota bacterium]